MKKENNTGLNSPEEFSNLSFSKALTLIQWIRENIEPSSYDQRQPSSYDLKDIFERHTKIYITNGAFKGAMLIAGFEPIDESKMNWEFNIFFSGVPF